MRRGCAIRRALREAAIAAAFTGFLVGPLMAQDIVTEPSREEGGAAATQLRHRVGLTPRLGLVSGFGDGSDGGFGIEGTGSIRLGNSPVWIRGDAGFLNLGETLHSSSGSTSGNTLLTLAVGPEVELPRGVVRPFVHLVAGYILNVPGGDVSPAETNGSGAFGLGGGVRFQLSSAPRPALIEAGLRIMRSGELTFALADETDDADVTTLELRLGLLLGLP